MAALIQTDLFEAPTNCGACVHRNGPAELDLAPCSPVGMRRADDGPCAWWFGRDQLNTQLYGRGARR